ncbi:arginine decarboxylase [Leptolyngbya sp. 'hensonii']|uniref:aminotransferase class I/II-fold pyridoxal phosphate-dependent enzyme n=1 Tax=Leptolyngbya sp. 'hensonii' TaxID=1922337 RepID=UPI00094F5E93|nr:aminotransferase class I/II-fold pyridoxal phosphate-dependent enzyme [Leptolyngbya sp. 'hensonii']OLP19020.1 arginine decarboxylase [Leptolyngbya sp. 'hensonii']
MHPETTPLLSALLQRAALDRAPFYTPGHKQGQGLAPSLLAALGSAPGRLDLPELPGLDNLAAPDGVIREAQDLAAATFGADHTWFLVNGSTAGVIAMILATCSPGDRILLPRNVHQSAIAGLILSGAVPVFVQPDYDPQQDLLCSLSPARVATALEQSPQIRAVLLVSPTYHGICGNVAAIAQIAHAHEIPLLVDEAHGPHFAFHPELPTPALAAGADLVVQSTHKVLSALTQAAMLHLRGQRIDPDRISRTLRLVQTTSPSYLLLASLDTARQQMALQGQEWMAHTLALADRARQQISTIPGLTVLGSDQVGSHPGFHALDRTRLTVTVAGLGLTGFAADEILDRDLGVTAEFPSYRHLTFIISLGNTEPDIDRLVQGLRTLAEQFPIQPPTSNLQNWDQSTLSFDLSTPVLSPRHAYFAPTEIVPVAQAIDRISAELICPYPPGIPLLLPGEPIRLEVIAALRAIQAAGGQITGCADSTLATLVVVKQ